MSDEPVSRGEGAHTQGWRLSAGDPLQVFDGRGCDLANVRTRGVTGRTYDDAKDCARLIAASPDLLAALEEAVASYGKPGGPWNVPSDPGGRLDRARAAIAKARGDA